MFGELRVSVHKWQGSCVMHCCHFWLGGLIPDTFQKQLNLLQRFFQMYAKADYHVSTFCSERRILSSGPAKSIYNVYFMTLMLNSRSSVCAVLQTCHITNTGMHHLGALLFRPGRCRCRYWRWELLLSFTPRWEQHLCCSAIRLLIAIVLPVVRFPEGTGLSGKLCEVLPHS